MQLESLESQEEMVDSLVRGFMHDLVGSFLLLCRGFQVNAEIGTLQDLHYYDY